MRSIQRCFLEVLVPIFPKIDFPRISPSNSLFRVLVVVPVRGHVQDARPPLNAAATTGKYIDNTTNIVTTVVAQSHVCVVTCSRWADAIMVVALLPRYVVACAACRVCRRRRAIMPDAGRKETPGYFYLNQSDKNSQNKIAGAFRLLDCWCLN